MQSVPAEDRALGGGCDACELCEDGTDDMGETSEDVTAMSPRGLADEEAKEIGYEDKGGVESEDEEEGMCEVCQVTYAPSHTVGFKPPTPRALS